MIDGSIQAAARRPDLLVDANEVARHPRRGEASLEVASNARAQQRGEPTDGLNGALHAGHQEAYSVINYFGYRSRTPSNGRLPVCDRLDHDKVKRLGPIDREKQRAGAAQEGILFRIRLSPPASTSRLLKNRVLSFF